MVGYQSSTHLQGELTPLQLKRMPPRAGCKSALRDPGVELDVSGKAISDEGFEEMIKALGQAISYAGEDGQILRLEEASFKSNELTATSLGLLASIIELSAKDLRDLDLSNNRIEVASSGDAINWEQFLLALNRCDCLRRVDLSGNALQPKAYEILSRVYAMQRHSEDRGLPSVPYLILLNTKMDDNSAMHLSYIISKHDYPERLLPQVPAPKPGPQTQLLESYDTIKGCRGIVYRPNPELGSAGTRVLELAEQARETIQENAHKINGEMPIPSVALKNLALSDNKPQLMTSNPRRRRTSSSETSISSPVSRASELDRARSRIQGDALKDGGLTRNDLWWTSLRMLKYARIILLQEAPIRTDWVAHAANSPIRHISLSEPRVGGNSRRGSSTSGASFEEAFPSLPSANVFSPRLSKIPLASGNPNVKITPRRAPTSKESISSKGPITFHNGPVTRIKAEEIPLPPSPVASQSDNDGYRSNLPCGFPEEIWTRILTLTANADNILSTRQQREVSRWAMDKSTLNEEMAILGKSEPQQIWKVLHGMGCLAYDDGEGDGSNIPL